MKKQKRSAAKRRKMSLPARLAMIMGILLVTALFLFFVLFYREYNRKTKDGNKITVEINEGTGTKELVSILKEKGVIRYQLPFYLKLYQSGMQGKLRYGKYELSDGMSLDDLIGVLTRGTAGEATVLTVPEGFTVEQIAVRLEKQGIMKADDFLEAVKKAASSVSFADELPAEDTVYFRLQGYLFPDTYFLDEDTTADGLVSVMLDEFDTKFDSECRRRAEELGMSVGEVLTRASMVEKETEMKDEFPVIAGVINNRLEKKMKLQFDSTVVYGMTDGQYGVDRVLYSHLKDDSAYNTYKIEGLPPGPICNPGIEAIKAVLWPDENPYLYFMMNTEKNDGSNLFFETYEEHMAAYSTMTHGEETTGASEEDSSGDTEEGR